MQERRQDLITHMGILYAVNFNVKGTYCGFMTYARAQGLRIARREVYRILYNKRINS